MKATYVGYTQNNFENGKEYYINSRIEAVSVPFGNVYKPRMCICIYEENGNAWAYYKNLEEVLCNWKF
jgi:hypothetical protein